MKLACSSASFDSAIASGAWTQLEWLDRCATDFDVDGVVVEARHLPRVDADYVAQIKKMATDLGLTVAGLACDGVLAPAEGGAETPWFEVAAALGAPLVIARAPHGGDAPERWSALVAAAKGASALAKRSNVPLAVRNARATPCAAAADLLQLAKEIDSAWLRFAIDPAALDPPGQIERILPKAIVAAHLIEPEADDRALDATIEALGAFAGFLTIEVPSPDDGGRLRAAVDRVRATLARRTLGR